MKSILLTVAAALLLQGCGGGDYVAHLVASCPGVPEIAFSREVKYNVIGGRSFGPNILEDGTELVRMPETCVIKRLQK